MKEQAKKDCRRCVYGRKIPRERGGLIVCPWVCCPLEERTGAQAMQEEHSAAKGIH